MRGKHSRRRPIGTLEGTRVGGYLLRDRLGHGSGTAVYRASAPSGELCALKLVDAQLEDGPSLAARLRRDAPLLSHVGDPRILPILDPIASDEMTGAVMPLVDAQSLRDLMRSGGPDSDLAWSILTQVADSLESAHQRGLTYKVLKPANILVRNANVYLAEFGVTGRWAGQVGLAAPNCRLDGAQYLAPEQILGEEPDHRSDIYALGVLAFELATCTALQTDPEPSVILRRTLEAAPPSASARNPQIPTDVDGVLRRALARDPAARYASVRQLIHELACPPATTAPDAFEEPAPEPPVDVLPDYEELTVDSLIDVLTDLLTPQDGLEGADG
jgi:serine/threonine protein kinase, bacterial